MPRTDPWWPAEVVGVEWSDVFDATGEGPAVFLVAPAHRGGVLAWARRQPVATVSRRDLHRPAVAGWAVLDGGVLQLHEHPAATLSPGVRVLGFGALRLLADELGLRLPPTLPGEAAAVDPCVLRAAHHRADPTCAGVVEQAELLATCTDAATLRWVAIALRLEPAPR